MLCHRPSGLQLLSYFLTVLLFPVACFSSVSLAFPICTTCLIASYVFVYAQNIFLTFFDVSPDELVIRRKQGIKPVKFDPRRHSHVIERGFCNICQIHVKEKTKHCRRCNICVEVFDHHCIWLNNCIGKKNYRLFIVLLVSIVFLSSGATVLGFLQLLFWISDTEHMQEMSAQIFSLVIPLWVWLLASFASFASHLAIGAVTAHLLRFHIKLWKKGITTYRFIIDQRQKKTASRETISAQNEGSIERVLNEGHAVEKLGDEWRNAVLKFHNEHRRKLAKGMQPTAGEKLMPPAKDMNELEWDSDMEKEAKAFICDPTLPSVDFGVTYDSIDLSGSNFNISTRTRAVLKKWWNQAKKTDLSSDPIYDREKIREFGNMALAKNTRLACAYGSCADGGKLLCMYDQMPMPTHALYQKASVPAEICTACSVSTHCVDSLCSSRKPDGSITDKWRNAVLKFHNEHRRKLAKGMQPTAGAKLMPPAKDMNELKWDSDMEEEAKAFICDPTLPSVDFGVTYGRIDLDGSSSDIFARTRAVLNKWWNKAKKTDLSSDPIYDREKIREFGVMALAKNTRLACAYGSCADGGKLLCMYDQIPMLSHALYLHVFEGCSAL
ncbi:hypothetical protein Y032_0610g624 [Ancylostoma ceylanicum]|uniref:Palmitoyltransferase n=1 Tax=Ancylostoma ceylanicum TaxID=53326 RepID=A0A016WN87_9BILA|nr:hypothetical protein Y032_0610g624 [Ancylostoma ceylanicum]